MGEIAINPTHNVHQKYRQMNLVNPYIFSVPVVAPNLYIGGVASTINTPELLAAKFQNYPSGTSFSALNIQNFAIVGSDIKCTVIADYSIIDSAFSNNSLITYYIDNLRCKEIKSAAFFSSLSTSGGIYMNIYKVHFENVIVIGSNAFNSDFGTYGLKIAEFPNATTINGTRTFINNNKLEIVYIPKITSLGDSVTDNQIFQSVKNAKIYANPVLQTSNSGGVEGDLSYASSQGNTIRYVPNYTTPNSITNLLVGNVYNTAIQLNFTPPSSINTIDYYEVHLNGVYANKIYASGEFITGLSNSTTYSISLYVVDIYYNKSLISNVVSQITTNNYYAEVSSYASRVSSDSGIIVDNTYVNREYDKMHINGLHAYLLFWHNYKSGMKKDGGNLVEKMYSFSGDNTDIIQTTTANKPTYTTAGITFDLTDTLTKTLTTSLTNRSFTVMFRAKSTPGNYYPLIDLGGWNSFTMHSATGGLIYGGITIANRFNLENGSFLSNVEATYTFTYNSVSKIAKLYRDSTLLSSKTMIDPVNFTSIQINSQNGTFYDSKMFSKDLTLTEIISIL